MEFLNFMLLLAPGMLVVGWQFAERRMNTEKIDHLHLGIIQYTHDMFELVKVLEKRIQELENERG